MIGKKLEGDDGQDGRNEIRTFGNADYFISQVGDLFSAFSSHGNHFAFASLYLLDAIDVFFVDRVIWSDHDRRNVRSDQRNHAMLKLCARVAFSKFVGNLLQLQSSL